MAARLLNALGSLGVGLVATGAVVNSALYNVDGGHRAVIFDRFTGVSPNIVGEGTHFLVPWVQRPIIFDIRAKPRNIPVATGSKDLQTVSVTLRILYRPKPEALPAIYTNLGIDYDERVLPSITSEVLKAVVDVGRATYPGNLVVLGDTGIILANYDAAEMITQREIVSSQVREELTKRAATFSILLDDISLTHLTFGQEFTMAVEQKQVAQQDAERARYLVEKEEHIKSAAIIRAEGESEAANLVAKAIGESGEGLIELRKIEAAEDIAYQLAQSRNVVYLPSGQQALLALPQ